MKEFQASSKLLGMADRYSFNHRDESLINQNFFLPK